MTNIPMTNPDLVTGVSLALLFAFAGTMMKINSILGFWTLLIAHITFNLPYVILSVMPKLTQMDPDLAEAAQDLGCTPFQSFMKVVIHEIMPGIISGLLMAFTMSLDDFVISYFVDVYKRQSELCIFAILGIALCRGSKIEPVILGILCLIKPLRRHRTAAEM